MLNWDELLFNPLALTQPAPAAVPGSWAPTIEPPRAPQLAPAAPKPTPQPEPPAWAALNSGSPALGQGFPLSPGGGGDYDPFKAFAPAKAPEPKKLGVLGESFGIMAPADQQQWLTDQFADHAKGSERIKSLEAAIAGQTSPYAKRALQAQLMAARGALPDLERLNAMKAGTAALPTKTGLRAGAENAPRGLAEAVLGIPEMIGIVKGYLGDEKVDDNALLKWSLDTKKYVAEQFPGDAARQADFSQKLANGVGQLGAFYGGGALASLARLGAKGVAATVALMGSSATGSQGFEEATAKLKEAQAEAARTGDKAAVEEIDRILQTVGYAAVGLTEAIPVAKTFSRLAPNPATGLGRRAVAAAEGSLEEGLQEGASQAAQNAIAAQTTDPARPLGQGVAESIAVGAVLGGGAGGAFGAAPAGPPPVKEVDPFVEPPELRPGEPLSFIDLIPGEGYTEVTPARALSAPRAALPAPEAGGAATVRPGGPQPLPGLPGASVAPEAGLALNEAAARAPQDRSPPGFYSAALRAAEALPEKGSPEQLLGILRNTPGVKPGELEWMELEDFVREQKPTTRQEIADYMAAHQAEFVDDMRGYSPEYAVLAQRKDDLEKELIGSRGRDLSAKEIGRLANELHETFVKLASHPEHTAVEGKPRYGGRGRPKGGSNYRELLLKSPMLEGKYTSDHFLTNELMHLRLDDRVGPQGEKTLNIVEQQSDLHQGGGRFGYKGTPAQRAKAQQEFDAGMEQLKNARANNLPPEKVSELIQRVGTLKDQMYRMDSPSSKPNAPFKGSSWEELGIKRALRMAAEQGYDAISWMRGDQTTGSGRAKVRTLYDVKMPGFLNRYTKKWGGKVEKVQLANSEGENNFLRITPEMRAALLGDEQPLFAARAQFNPEVREQLPAEQRFNKDGLELLLPYAEKWGNPRFDPTDQQRALGRIAEIGALDPKTAPWADLRAARDDLREIVAQLFYYDPAVKAEQIDDFADEVWRYGYEKSYPGDAARAGSRPSIFSTPGLNPEVATIVDAVRPALDRFYTSKRAGLVDMMMYGKGDEPTARKPEPERIGEARGGFYFKSGRELANVPDALFAQGGQAVIDHLTQAGVKKAEIKHFGLEALAGKKSTSREEFARAIADRTFEFRRKTSWFNPESNRMDYAEGGTRAFSGPRIPGRGVYFERLMAFPKKLKGGADFAPGHFESPHWEETLKGTWASWRGSVREVPGWGNMVIGEEGQTDLMQGAATGRRPRVKPEEFLEQQKTGLQRSTPETPIDDSYVRTMARDLLLQAASKKANAVAVATSDTTARIQNTPKAAHFYDAQMKPALERELRRITGDGGLTLEKIALPKPMGGKKEKPYTVWAARLAPEVVAKINTEGQPLFAQRAQMTQPALPAQQQPSAQPRGSKLTQPALPEQPYRAVNEPGRAGTDRRIELNPALTGKQAHQQAKLLADAGRTVQISSELSERILGEAEALSTMIPEGTLVGALTRIEPAGFDEKGKPQIRAVFALRGGGEQGLRTTLKQLSALRATTATTADGRRAILFPRLDPAESSRDRIRGELWHENLHILRGQGNIPADAFNRLLGHATDLRVLDIEYRAFARATRDPRAEDYVPGITIRKLYAQELYKDRPNLDEVMAQEAVAHLLELYSHGALTEQQIAPIQDVIEAIRSGEYARRPATPRPAAGGLHAARPGEGPQGDIFSAMDDPSVPLVAAGVAKGVLQDLGKLFKKDYPWAGWSGLSSTKEFKTHFRVAVKAKAKQIAEAEGSKSPTVAGLLKIWQTVNQTTGPSISELPGAKPAKTEMSAAAKEKVISEAIGKINMQAAALGEEMEELWDEATDIPTAADGSNYIAYAKDLVPALNKVKAKVATVPGGAAYGKLNQFKEQLEDALASIGVTAEEIYAQKEPAPASAAPNPQIIKALIGVKDAPQQLVNAVSMASSMADEAGGNVLKHFKLAVNQATDKADPSQDFIGWAKALQNNLMFSQGDVQLAKESEKLGAMAVAILNGLAASPAPTKKAGPKPAKEWTHAEIDALENKDFAKAKFMNPVSAIQDFPGSANSADTLEYLLKDAIEEAKAAGEGSYKKPFIKLVIDTAKGLEKLSGENAKTVAAQFYQLAQDLLPGSLVSSHVDPQPLSLEAAKLVAKNMGEAEVAALEEAIWANKWPNAVGAQLLEGIATQLGVAAVNSGVTPSENIKKLVQGLFAGADNLKKNGMSAYGSTAAKKAPVYTLKDMFMEHGSTSTGATLEQLYNNLYEGGEEPTSLAMAEAIEGVLENDADHEDADQIANLQEIVAKLKGEVPAADTSATSAVDAQSVVDSILSKPQPKQYPTAAAALNAGIPPSYSMAKRVITETATLLYQNIPAFKDAGPYPSVAGTAEFKAALTEQLKKTIQDNIAQGNTGTAEHLALFIASLDPKTQVKEQPKLPTAPKGLTFDDLIPAPQRNYTFASNAGGGTKPKEIWKDDDGNEYLFKPVPSTAQFLAYGEAAGGHIARLVNPRAPRIWVQELNGRLGSMQEMLPNSGTLKGTAMKDLTLEQAQAIQREHVVDWLISNHDGHANQFLVLEGGEVVGIDKGQAYKYFGKDRLAIDYHPNEVYGEQEPIYNTFWRTYSQNQLTNVKKKLEEDYVDDLAKLEEKIKLLNSYVTELSETAEKKQAEFEKFKSEVASETAKLTTEPDVMPGLSEKVQKLEEDYFARLEKARTLGENEYWLVNFRPDRPTNNLYKSFDQTLYESFGNRGIQKTRFQPKNGITVADAEKLLKTDLQDGDKLEASYSSGAPALIAALQKAGYDHVTVPKKHWDADRLIALTPVDPGEAFDWDGLRSSEAQDLLAGLTEAAHAYVAQALELVAGEFLNGAARKAALADAKSIRGLKRTPKEEELSYTDEYGYSRAPFTSLLSRWASNAQLGLDIRYASLARGKTPEQKHGLWKSIVGDTSYVLTAEFPNYIRDQRDLHAPEGELTEKGLAKLSGLRNTKRAELYMAKNERANLLARGQDIMFRAPNEAIVALQQNLSTADFQSILRPYAQGRWPKNPAAVDAFLDYARQRKENLGAKFHRFFVELSDRRKRGMEALKEDENYSDANYPILAKQFKKQSGVDLTTEEFSAIYNYTGSTFHKLNRNLRETVPIEAQFTVSKDWLRSMEYASLLEAALEKLPPYRGEVYRGQDMHDEELAQFYPGRVFHTKTFFSTSGKGGFSGRVRFVINSLTGRHIRDLSSHPSEDEVLFAPNRNFLVQYIDRDSEYKNQPIIEIHLLELPEVDFNEIR